MCGILTYAYDTPCGGARRLRSHRYGRWVMGAGGSIVQCETRNGPQWSALLRQYTENNHQRHGDGNPGSLEDLLQSPCAAIPKKHEAEGVNDEQTPVIKTRNEDHDATIRTSTRLEEALVILELALREELYPPRHCSQIPDTMCKVRDVLASAMAHSHRLCSGEEGCIGTISRVETAQPENTKCLGYRRDIKLISKDGNACGRRLEFEIGDQERVRHAMSSSVRGGGVHEEENLASLACMAGKRGDVTALQDFGARMDLNCKDAFGRNALYYACLCGHLGAAHFIVTHTYAGVKGIPRDALWECRKNALTEEVRHYLDTGILPTENSTTAALPVSPPHDRRTLTLSNEGKRSSNKCSSTVDKNKRSRDEVDRAGAGAVGLESAEGGAIEEGKAQEGSSSSRQAFSIASLYGDEEKGHDY